MNFLAPGRIRDARTEPNLAVECDYCVVGSGAGGSIAAAVLAQAGARVMMVEEGDHHTKRDFNMQEAWAYDNLYQDHGNRATEDLSIMILQGRTVGGGTTVNWTSSFRTPERTLALWASRHGVVGLDAATLAPHFAAVEERLSIREGNPDDVNANNRKLLEGARKLGWGPELIRRSVKGCARLGYCGLGCPIDAKQSALITYVPDALAAGAHLFTNARAKLVETDRGRAKGVVCDVLDPATHRPRRFVVYARRGVVLAGGAINTPALLLRSKIVNASDALGRRTFLHPTVPLLAYYDEPIEGFYGAPQSVACHHFADRAERVGYFLETAPVHPMLSAVAFPGFGDFHRKAMERLAHAQATIALLVDGHHDDEGGRVAADRDDRIRVAYPLSPALREAGVDAIKNMARLQLAAGAREVVTLHEDPIVIRSEADLAKVDGVAFGPNRHTLFSAHQMGGAAMGTDRATSVVDSRGKHHELENLWVADGSIFPTSLGVNPQLSIYAHARLFASELASHHKS
ncbi:MAG TPA: GMC family oxidoreductase [Polyangia bacterium]|jgi:choline dehydrogenase-like flavoprotein